LSLKNIYFTNVIAQGLSRVFSFGSNFLVFILIARIGGVEVFGQYSYILTFLGIFIIVADFGMSSVLAKDIAQPRQEPEKYLGIFLIVRAIFNFFAIMIAVIIAFYIRHDLFLCMMMGALAIPFLASRFFEPIFQVYHHPWFSTYPSIIYSVSYFALSVLVLITTHSLMALISVYIIANVLYAVVAFYFSQKLVKPVFTIESGIFKSILKLSIPIGISSIFAIISSRAAVFMLAGMKSDYEVGIYNAAYRFLDLSAMLAVTFVAPLVPIFANKAASDQKSLKRNWISIVEFLAIAIIPIAIICPFISDDIVRVIFGNNFIQSSEVLNVLAWVGVLVVYSLFSTAAALSLGIVHFGYWNTAVAAILSITLNYLWIPKYNFVGSAWAALICELFLLGVTCFYIIRHVGNFIRPFMWLKIVSANLILLVAIELTASMSLLSRLTLSLSVYVVMIVLFKIIRITDIPSDITKRVKFLYLFIYSEQVKINFPISTLMKYVDHKWKVPEGYILRSPDESTNLKEWAELLNSDGDFGTWTPEKIKTEIIDKMIDNRAGTLLYYKDRLIGCATTVGSLCGRVGVGMWLFLAPSHRNVKGLAHSLTYRTLAFFVKAKFDKVIAYTDSDRLSAIYLYLSNGAEPAYDSISSFLKWRRILKRLKPLLDRAKKHKAIQ